jgi:glycopeptide antibiotics resistance protein
MKVNLLKSILFILYVSVLIYIVFLLPRRQELTSHADTGYIHLTPFKNTIDSYYLLQGHSLEARLLFFCINFFGNIALFIPLPILLIQLFKQSDPKLIIGTGAIISIVIEVLQYYWRIGIPDIDDVLLNIIGVVVGFFLENFWHDIKKQRKNKKQLLVVKYANRPFKIRYR